MLKIFNHLIKLNKSLQLTFIEKYHQFYQEQKIIVDATHWVYCYIVYICSNKT